MFSKTKIRLVQTGDLIFQIESNVSSIHYYLDHHYQQCLLSQSSDLFIDYYISIRHGSWYRRFFKPQVNFFLNHHAQFKPLPLSQAHALLEWGINWVIATLAHQYLIIHAASLEKNGKGIIITAPSGSGKSTLCAYLVSQGWRLLSDEQALIDLKTLKMHGLARPINLKNNSIDLMKKFFCDEHFSTTALDTHKGTICLVKPPSASIEQASKAADPHLIVFVNYNEKEPLFIEQVNKPIALVEVIKNTFNFGLLNIDGFHCAKKLIDACNTIYLEYSNLNACEQALLSHLEYSKRDSINEKAN